MRIVFCDDNAADLQTMQAYVLDYFQDRHGETPEYAAYTDGDALLREEGAADMAFLDVKMAGANGISVGGELKKRNPHVKLFIVTAYPDYLDDAMRFQVFRYLSKPLDKERLYRNLQDAMQQYVAGSKSCAVSTDSGLEVLDSSDIVSVETSQRKVRIHTIHGSYLSSETMEYWQKTLDLPSFYVTHRSCIVNMRYVARIAKDTVFLKYGEQEWTAYLTGRSCRAFQKAFLSYLEALQ